MIFPRGGAIVDSNELWKLVVRVCRRNDDGPEAKRQLLVDLWLRVRKASRNDVHRFESQDPSDFVSRVRDFEHALISGQRPAGDGDFLELAAFSAALDRVLLEDLSRVGLRRGYAVHSVSTGIPAREYWLAQRRRHLDQSVVAVRQRMLPHAAFRYHRVIPKIVGPGVCASIIEFPADHVKRVFKGQPTLTIGAGVFADGVELEVAMGGASFEVIGFQKDRTAIRELTVKEQLRRALRDPKVGAILFPEMMISKEFEPQLLEVCRELLEERDDGRALLVVPGSFHHRAGRKVLNTSSLYLVGKDFSSVEVLRHGKFAPAWIARVLEGIEPSDSISLVATPVGLWMIAICMDFCAAQTDAIWRDLDVDLVLVPSLGNEETLRLHGKRLSDLSLRQRLQVVLAQQMLVSAENGSGLKTGARGVVRAGDRKLRRVRGHRGLHRVTLDL